MPKICKCKACGKVLKYFDGATVDPIDTPSLIDHFLNVCPKRITASEKEARLFSKEYIEILEDK